MLALSDPVRSVGFYHSDQPPLMIMSTDEENDHVPDPLSTVSHVRETATASALVVREPSSRSLRQADAIRRVAQGHPNSSLHGQISQLRGQTDQTEEPTRANLQATAAALSANTVLPAPQKVASGFATSVIGPLAGIIMVEVSEDARGMSLDSQRRIVTVYSERGAIRASGYILIL